MTTVTPERPAIAEPTDAAPDFAVHTVSGDGRETVVVRGELDIATSPLLSAVLDGVGQRRPALVEVDLAAVTYLDASSVSGLIAAHRRLAESGCTLVLSRPGRLARRVLELTGFADAVRSSPGRAPERWSTPSPAGAP